MNGKAQVTWDGLDYNKTYKWYVVVKDSDNTVTSQTWNFTTKEEAGMEINLLEPESGETGISRDADLEVRAVHPEDKDMTIEFYNANTDSFIDSDDVSGEGEAEVSWEDLEYNTTYGWYVKADDGDQTVTSQTWNFTTKAQYEYISPAADAGQDIEAETGEEVEFKGQAYDDDGQVTQYRWDFDGDGTWDYESIQTGETTYTYNESGNYTARFQAKDDDGMKDTDTVLVKVTESEGEIPTETFTETVQIGETGNKNVRVKSKYTYYADSNETKIVMSFENRGNEEKAYTLTMMIPKTVAETTSDVTMFPSPDEVILEDPTVAWNISLAPLESFQVSLISEGYIEASEYEDIQTNAREIEITEEEETEEQETTATGLSLGMLGDPAVGLVVLVALVVVAMMIWKRKDIKKRLRENLRK